MTQRNGSRHGDVTAMNQPRVSLWRRLRGEVAEPAGGVVLADVIVQTLADRPVWIADLFGG